MAIRVVKLDDIHIGARRRQGLGDVSALAQSMAEVGLLEPIVVTADMRLVAGYRRLRAARLLGWEEITATIVDFDALAIELAEIDENLERAELTVLERGEHLLRRKEIYEALYPETRAGRSQAMGMNAALGHNVTPKIGVTSFVDDMAAKTGVSRSTIRSEVQIASQIPEPVRDAIRKTPIADSKNDLLLLAHVPPEKQPRVAGMIVSGQAATVAQARRLLAAETQPSGITSPIGKYKAIVIDPPWPVTKISREVRPNQAEFDYPTMRLEEIEALPIPTLADEDGCHIYLWVTQKHLPDGLHLFDIWGVRYQCIMTWVKNVGFTPFSWMYSTEHVLFGHIGNLALLKLGLRLDFAAPVREHSRKPDVFYDLVAAASPEPRLDMFSREPRDGFMQWGNEIGKWVTNTTSA